MIKIAEDGVGREAGFSLIEMLVVLAIVSLVAGIAFSSFHPKQLNSSATVIARDIGQLAQLLRIQAISRHRALPLNFDIETRTVFGGDGTRHVSIPQSITLEVLTGQNLIQSQRQASIVFFPDGSSSGGTVTLSSDNSKEVVLRIPWLTGIPSLEPGIGDAR